MNSFLSSATHILNPFVHSSIHECYFMFWLGISITALQNETFKSSKDPVLCICMNFKKYFLPSWIHCQIKALWFKMSEGVGTFAKIVHLRKFLKLKMGITLLNMDGFSKFKIWVTAKNQENLSLWISKTYTLGRMR